jgi:hypothetical protein
VKPTAADARGMRIQWMPDAYRMDNVCGFLDDPDRHSWMIPIAIIG